MANSVDFSFSWDVTYTHVHCTCPFFSGLYLHVHFERPLNFFNLGTSIAVL